MRISIVSLDLKRPLRLIFPTRLIKTKFVWKMIGKKSKDSDFDFKPMYQVAKRGYKDLKRFIKINGHFNLVEIIDQEGNVVIIRI